MPILDHFSWFAPYYDRLIKPGDAEKMLALLQLSSSTRVLDVGGGTGRSAEMARLRTSHILIADLSPAMLAQAAAKGFQVTAAASEALPFPAGAFDRVIMVDALHHVCDQPQTAGELWRVLAPGGKIVIEEFNLHVLWVKWIALAEKLALMRSHFLNPLQIAALFAGAPADASIQIETEGATVWVIVTRLAH